MVCAANGQCRAGAGVGPDDGHFIGVSGASSGSSGRLMVSSSGLVSGSASGAFTGAAGDVFSGAAGSSGTSGFFSSSASPNIRNTDFFSGSGLSAANTMVGRGGLKIEPDSAFGRHPPEGLPSPDEAADFYLYAVEHLEHHGYLRSPGMNSSNISV